MDTNTMATVDQTIRSQFVRPGGKHTIRTINVIKEVPGIATEVQVNIAYEHAPGVTYLQARQFEEELALKIQEDLYELSAGTTAEPVQVDLISIPEAMKITKHGTRKAFYSWRSRFNARNPKHCIIYRTELVDRITLTRALRIQSGEVAE